MIECEKCLPPKSIPSSSHLSEINVKCYKKQNKRTWQSCVFLKLFEQTNRPLDKLFGWYFMSLYNISGLSTWGLVYVEMCSQCAKTVSHNSKKCVREVYVLKFKHNQSHNTFGSHAVSFHSLALVIFLVSFNTIILEFSYHWNDIKFRTFLANISLPKQQYMYGRINMLFSCHFSSFWYF